MTPEDRIAQLETQVADIIAKRTPNLVFGQYNPFYTRGAGRIILEIPFDLSLDSVSAMECFFQMPTQTRAIRAAKVWGQQKNYRTNSSTASTVTGGSIASGGPSGTRLVADGGSTASTHTHTDPQGGSTGADSAPGYISAISTASVADSTHGHTTNISSHTHTLDTVINEVAPSGTLSLYVADDGTNYGSAITTGQSSFVGLDIKSQLTKTSGDKRIKITTSGKARVQILLLLDLRVSVL